MKVQEIIEMNKHNKQTIYEAYSIEYHARKAINADLNQERRLNAGLRFDCQYWQDAWLEENVRNHVAIDGDIDEALDYYFAHKKRFLLTTVDKGYYAFVDEGSYIFIIFAWHNPKGWSRERKNMLKLIRDIVAWGKPIRYTGVNNIMRKHSIEIEPGLFQLDL